MRHVGSAGSAGLLIKGSSLCLLMVMRMVSTIDCEAGLSAHTGYYGRPVDADGRNDEAVNGVSGRMAAHGESGRRHERVLVTAHVS